jgi:hypothetical protein
MEHLTRNEIWLRATIWLAGAVFTVAFWFGVAVLIWAYMH